MTTFGRMTNGKEKIEKCLMRAVGLTRPPKWKDDLDDRPLISSSSKSHETCLSRGFYCNAFVRLCTTATAERLMERDLGIGVQASIRLSIEGVDQEQLPGGR